MNATVRQPAVAGRFYPGDSAVLARTVDAFLQQARVDANGHTVSAILAPHAAIRYSGRAAAHAYRRVGDKPLNRAILLGCSHHCSFQGASIVTGGEFATPLGSFPVDTGFADALAAEFGNAGLQPHIPEHCLEIQLPFLARSHGLIPIVPVLFGSSFGPWHDAFTRRLAQMTTQADLLIATTDLSHYLSESEANAIDARTLDTLVRGDVDALVEAVDQGLCSMCSVAAAAAASRYALKKGADSWRVLDYRTSAEAAGDRERVVGYAAVSFEEEE